MLDRHKLFLENRGCVFLTLKQESSLSFNSMSTLVKFPRYRTKYNPRQRTQHRSTAYLNRGVSNTYIFFPPITEIAIIV